MYFRSLTPVSMNNINIKCLVFLSYYMCIYHASLVFFTEINRNDNPYMLENYNK